ncbi:unnamed protein product [Didymodactylos carnosus]|uniref:Uncharacterized protein n=1 Tax=Didymodactylos carnosus TaxID=1234261 RepID=A0A815CMW1_9BILA|nr:unnamed protein product [Didymodactylos carnosus]CAF4094033.1 unnamed protein product [Didymodactylos carnosus]
MRSAYVGPGSSTRSWQATLDPGTLSPNSNTAGYRVSWTRDLPRTSLTHTQEMALVMLREQDRRASEPSNSASAILQKKK